MWSAPVLITFLPPILAPALENGGFMMTAVGRISGGRMLFNCSAFSAVMRVKGSASIIVRRCGDISLPVTSATPAVMAWTAKPPVPADGSITRSPGRRFAAHAAAKA